VVLAVTEHDRAGRGAAGIGGAAGNPADDRLGGAGSVVERPSGASVIARDAGRAVTDWARARSLGPSSACGISIALILCAAAWLSAGSRADNFRAVVALWAGYLVFLAGRNLIAWPGEGMRIARGVTPVRSGVRARTTWLAALGWCLCECAIYGGLAVGAAADHWPGTWTLAIAVLSLTAVRELMTASLGPPDPNGPERGRVWRAIESVVRLPAGGRILLIGIVAPVWGSRTVLLALLDWAIIAIGFGLASQPAGSERRARDPSPDVRRSHPPGLDAQASLAVLLRPALAGPEQDVQPADDVGAGVGAAGDVQPADDVGAGVGAAGDVQPTGDVGAGIGAAGDVQPAGDAGAVVGAVPGGGSGQAAGTGTWPTDEPAPSPAQEEHQGGWQQPGQGARLQVDNGEQAGQDAVAAVAATAQGRPRPNPAVTERLLRLRDDGALARWMGGPVKGSLLPLPPAVLALAAMAVLTILGLQNLPSVLFLTPALVMLLAAPGSSNPHAGRLDWLVPPILLGAQFLYFTAIGQAKGIPGPVTLALCAAVMLRYADLACPARPVVFARPLRRTWSMELSQTDRERGSALGWEGRMLLMGAGAAAGIGTFAFIALTAYLGMLICAKVLTSMRLREGSGP